MKKIIINLNDCPTFEDYSDYEKKKLIEAGFDLEQPIICTSGSYWGKYGTNLLICEQE